MVKKFINLAIREALIAYKKSEVPVGAVIVDENNKVISKAHNLVGCRGVTRSDFKYYRGKFYLLEINTQPGMTKLSLVPEIAAFRGISFIKLIELILKDASTNK